MTTKTTIEERIKAAGICGITSKELRAQLGLAAGTATGRVSELRKSGLVKSIGRRDGAFVLVWNASGPVSAGPATTKIHYELLVDNSGSMVDPINGKRKSLSALELVEAQVRALDKMPSIWTFSGKGDLQEARASGDGFGTPLGDTPLFIRSAEAIDRAMQEKGSKVVLVFTDGEATDQDNAYEFLCAMKRANDAGDVTVAFMVPKGHREHILLNAGVSPDNIQFWTTVEEASKNAVVAAQKFKKAVARGARRSVNYFKADLSQVTVADLERLRDVSDEASLFTVAKEEGIDTFFAAKKKLTGGTYTPGTGFYEIMKRERRIPDGRKLLLLAPQTGRIYTDGKVSVRKLCGYPERGEIAVQPGNHAGFVLLAQSKSSAETTHRARILPRGTRAILWSGAVS